MSSIDFHALTPALVILALSIFVAWGNLKEPKKDKESKEKATLL